MTTVQLSLLTGATPRQLQWWDEKGYISPVLYDHVRDYSKDDAVGVALMVKLRSAGVTPKRIARVVRSLQKHAAAQWLVLLPKDKQYWATNEFEAMNVADGVPVVVARIRRFEDSEVPAGKTLARRKPRRRPQVPGVRATPAAARRFANRKPDPVERRMAATANAGKSAPSLARNYRHEIDWERVDVLRAEMAASQLPGYVRP